MAHYCIGDVHGCLSELQALLKKINYQEAIDKLWFTGDLVNRGPDSLGVLKFIRSLKNTTVVLGNHDLHLLAIAYGSANPRNEKEAVLAKAVLDHKLGEWLRHLPLAHYDSELGYMLVHAGIPPQWNLAQTLSYAREVETVLKGDDFAKFLVDIGKNFPIRWKDSLTGEKRLRLIVAYLTRMRFCNSEGILDLHRKSHMHPHPTYQAWFKIPRRLTKNVKVIFGHWSALKGRTREPHVYPLDTGCAWGESLTAMRLEDAVRFQVSCVTCVKT